jgi:ABC-type uncharacterized transport system permease subunit
VSAPPAPDGGHPNAVGSVDGTATDLGTSAVGDGQVTTSAGLGGVAAGTDETAASGTIAVGSADAGTTAAGASGAVATATKATAVTGAALAGANGVSVDRSDVVTAASVLPRSSSVLSTAGRWAGAIAGALVIFSALVLVKGANPIAALADMVMSMLAPASLEQIAIKAAPLILAAMAVVLPARAGLANVGGEGQIIIGAVCAAGVGLAVDSAGPVALVAMLVAGALGGALWAGIAAAMRLTVGVNEAVTTLLLNYVALDVMLYLIYEPWKDPNGSGQPATRPLEVAARLPLLGTTAVHVGIVIALVAALVVWLVLRGTAFGFRLGVVGGNPEAARRARLPVARLLLVAMLLGGALAGLAGVVHLAGVEFKLRPGLTANIGYIAFLAAWLARHRPLPAVGGAFLLAAIVVGGDSLQLDSGLPAATVNVLMGLVLLAVLGWTARRPRNAAG